MSAINPMDEGPVDAVPSTAAIHGHPIHPMIIPFPIAFLMGALVTDIIFLVQGDDFWASCSYWLLFAGVAMGLVAAVFGIADFFGNVRVRNLTVAKLHFAGNAAALTMAAINVALRIDDVTARVAGEGVWLSVAVAVVLVGTGWLGGELAYRKRVGVIPQAGVGRRHGS